MVKVRYVTPVVSAVKAQRALAKGGEGYLIYVVDVSKDVIDVKNIPAVDEFPDTFPDEILGFPLEREVEVKIELVPGTKPISRALYRLAPTEMKELKQQLARLANGDNTYGFVFQTDGTLCLSGIFVVPEDSKLRDEILSQARRRNLSIHPGSMKMYKDLKTSREYSFDCMARLYIQEILNYHGVPTSIVSDRDPHFTSRFWGSFQNVLGTTLSLSTAYRLETDGQSERTVQTLEYMLRACALDFGPSWHDHLLLVEFAYNNNYYNSIGMAPFEAYGRHCRTPLFWDEVGERQVQGPELLHQGIEVVELIKKRI
ncbi:uncharacterized protein [Primulina eburnea]|uniref:uncharacterized protein n=1 Tax=Primulina eburnea TaxID=1245227 RepID=UPI003C6C4748